MSAIKTAWPVERVARLGFLVGQGWQAERIASDPAIATTTNNVNRQVQRFGLSLRAAKAGILPLPEEHAAVFDGAASRRGKTRAQLVCQLLSMVAAEPVLIDNILDDGA